MILKDVRLLVLAVLLGVSLYFIISPLLSGRVGVVVAKIASNAKCNNIRLDFAITQVSATQIKNLDDFHKSVLNIKGDEFVSLIADGLPANCVALEDGNIGFTVAGVKKENLVFGIDIQGGSRVLLKPKRTITKSLIDDTISVLTTRINLYGLRDLRIYTIGENLIQIEMGGATSEEIVNFLSRQGKFEGKLEQTVKLKDAVGSLTFAGKSISIGLSKDGVIFDNEQHKFGELFTKDGITVEIKNVTNETIGILSTVFTGKDIVAVFTDPQNSYLAPVGNGYEFSFAIQTSQESAERFAKLTRNQPIRLGGSERYLDPVLVLFLDEDQVTSLNIVASLAGQSLTKPTLQGFRETREAALNERLQLQSVLKSGSLPVELEIIKTDVVTQTAGRALLSSTIYVVIAAAIIVSIVILFRYRDFKIVVPMLIISFSEILLILGFAAFTQSATKGAGWVLDVPAIAGLIAIIGTGVNQLIIITDQMLQEKETTVRQRHKAAMAIIFNSASIVIAAMLPLVIAGVGALKGFAITTIIGVLIAISITRPAYTSILEKVKQLS